ncbi:hypothetical protein AB0B15_10560 [Streptomyces sp. NPDC045456]|uniref:hypothetical protein n=1 Tax=Streptomyces sp. NPDC045456 TaxID=3155254 RepID=UPI0033D8A8BF
MNTKAVPPSEAAYNLFLIIGKGDRTTGTETDYVQLYLSGEPDNAEEYVPEGWELLEDESEEVVRGYHNCDCCGIQVIDRRQCRECRENPGTCDPAVTWHCFTNYCDGSGCTFEGECEPNHEVRVWRETGDLVGLWEVEAEGPERVVVAQREGYERDAVSIFTSLWTAWQYAQGCAELHATTLRQECECGEGDCGVLHEHGISIQEVTSNSDLSRA